MQKSKEIDAAQYLTKDFVGYGHYRLNIVSGDGRKLSAVTGDTELVANLDSLIDTEKNQAIKEAIKFVIANN